MADTLVGAGAVVRSHARIATLPDKARTYMIQMCKHFAHKVEATFDDVHGRIALGERICELEVSAPDVLRISLTADDEMCNMAVVFTPDDTTAACTVVETSDGILPP